MMVPRLWRRRPPIGMMRWVRPANGPRMAREWRNLQAFSATFLLLGAGDRTGRDFCRNRAENTPRRKNRTQKGQKNGQIWARSAASLALERR